MRYLRWWLSTLFSGRPHIYIGGEVDPYLKRWFLIPKNALMGLFLHKFERDDDDRAYHDHPFGFISIMIWGRYIEFSKERHDVRSAPSIAVRSATWAHRVVLPRDVHGKPVPCWTIVLTGPKVRDWGFWCAQGWIHSEDFLDPINDALPGKGCDQ